MAKTRMAWIGGIVLLVLSLKTLQWACLGHGQLNLPESTDLLLMRLPRLNVVPVLSYGWFLLHASCLLCAWRFERGRIPYFLATMGLFGLVRNVFIALNPVGPPLGMLRIYSDPGLAFLDHELFFSGHTGLPYLYFLMLRKPPKIRALCLAVSLIMGASVLLTRNHYANDVLGAYFITYSIHALSRRLFGGWDKP